MSAGWPAFGYEGKPSTCVWCGRRLHHKTVIDPGSPQRYPQNLVRAKKAGAYQDDLFDTMTCGFLFGRQLAKLGHRLERGTG